MDRYAALQSTSLNGLPRPDYEQVAKILGRYAQNQLYRQLLLSKISELWVDYLTKVEALRVSVRMEAYGQRDPLVIYKNQATTMFSDLLSDVRAAVIAQMFRVRLVSSEDLKKAQSSAQPIETQPARSGRQRHGKKRRKRH